MPAFLEQGEPGLTLIIHFDLLNEHRIGAHPEARLVVKRAVDDQRFQGFAMPCHTYHLVFSPFIVTVTAKRE